MINRIRKMADRVDALERKIDLAVERGESLVQYIFIVGTFFIALLALIRTYR